MVIPNLLSLSKNQHSNLIRRIFYQRCVQEGFPVLLEEEGVGVNGALLTLQPPLSRSWVFLEKGMLDLFFFQCRGFFIIYKQKQSMSHSHV